MWALRPHEYFPLLFSTKSQETWLPLLSSLCRQMSEATLSRKSCQNCERCQTIVRGNHQSLETRFKALAYSCFKLAPTDANCSKPYFIAFLSNNICWTNSPLLDNSLWKGKTKKEKTSNHVHCWLQLTLHVTWFVTWSVYRESISAEFSSHPSQACLMVGTSFNQYTWNSCFIDVTEHDPKPIFILSLANIAQEYFQSD